MIRMNLQYFGGNGSGGGKNKGGGGDTNKENKGPVLEVKKVSDVVTGEKSNGVVKKKNGYYGLTLTKSSGYVVVTKSGEIVAHMSSKSQAESRMSQLEPIFANK